jgi:hypothetical protein
MNSPLDNSGLRGWVRTMCCTALTRILKNVLRPSLDPVLIEHPKVLADNCLAMSAEQRVIQV